MRIAYLNRGRETHSGGDIIALDATMAALRRKGVECVETGWDVERMRDGKFDLAHVFHCNFSWSLGNVAAVMEAGLKYVLTPIHYPELFSGITRRDFALMVRQASAVTPFSNYESSEILTDMMKQADFGCDRETWRIIPNGTDESFHCSNDYLEPPSPSTRRLDPMKRIGVLCVSARGENDKGIPQVKAICEKLRIPFTAISGIPHDQLPPIYKAHRLFVNNSDSERMSLTVGEALCAGCRVVSNHGNRGSEHYRNLVVDYITEDLIARSYNLPDWDYLPNHDARQLTWDLVATRLIKVYGEVLR